VTRVEMLQGTCKLCESPKRTKWRWFRREETWRGHDATYETYGEHQAHEKAWGDLKLEWEGLLDQIRSVGKEAFSS
jgi:hypothetical protein